MTWTADDRRGGPSLDALLPAEMAQRAEDIGARKAGMDGMSLFALAVLAGAFIALGAVFATVSLAGAGTMPWGAGRVLAGVVFSLGLILVVIGGAELFTGNNLIVMAWASRRVSTAALVRNWIIVFAGNAVGAVATACVVYVARTHLFGGGAVGQVALSVAHAKLQLGFVQAVALGMLCNALVCMAVWLTYSCRSTTDKIVAIVPPIAAFVAAGFEHSIANLYFIPAALLIAALDPAFALSRGLEQQAAALSLSGFLAWNLLPVTIGNVIGGVVMVGAGYWFVYLRSRAGR